MVYYTICITFNVIFSPFDVNVTYKIKTIKSGNGLKIEEIFP